MQDFSKPEASLSKFKVPNDPGFDFRGVKIGTLGVFLAVCACFAGWSLPASARPITTAVIWIGFLVTAVGMFIHAGAMLTRGK